MNKTVKIGLIAFICLGSSFVAKAQKVINEGTVTYAVEYDLPPDQQAMVAMLPTEYKVDFKAGISKFRMDMGMFATEVVYNNNTEETLSLTDVPMQNKKIAVKMNGEQYDKMNAMQYGEKDYSINETTETKKIGAYNCVKYVLTDKISNESVDVWTTSEVQIPINSVAANFKMLKGTPVEFSINAQGLKTKISLKEVKESAISDIKMDIPSDYETLTFEELLKQMGG